MRTYTFPTVESVLNAAISETLGTANRTPTALQDTALIAQLDVINRLFVDAAYDREPALGWEWMEDVVNFQTVSSTTLNGALLTSSTSVVLTSASDFDSSGRIWIETGNNAIDFVDYTGKSSNTLSGATDIDIVHASGERVEKCYPLPSDFGKVLTVLLDNQEYLYVRTRTLPVGRSFTTRGAYLVFPEGVGDRDGTLWYEKAPTDLSSGDDTADKAKSLDIPEDFRNYAVGMLKAHILMIDGQDERVPAAQAQAQDALSRAYAHTLSTATSLSLRPSY